MFKIFLISTTFLLLAVFSLIQTYLSYEIYPNIQYINFCSIAFGKTFQGDYFTSNRSTCQYLRVEKSNNPFDCLSIPESGKCLTRKSIKMNNYLCDKLSNQKIENECKSELLFFHEKELLKLPGADFLKESKQISVAIGQPIWAQSFTVDRLAADGSIELWLNGTRYKCQPGIPTLLRSDGSHMSRELIYYVTKCTLNGNIVTLDYFTLKI